MVLLLKHLDNDQWEVYNKKAKQKSLAMFTNK